MFDESYGEETYYSEGSHGQDDAAFLIDDGSNDSSFKTKKLSKKERKEKERLAREKSKKDKEKKQPKIKRSKSRVSSTKPKVKTDPQQELTRQILKFKVIAEQVLNTWDLLNSHIEKLEDCKDRRVDAWTKP